MKEVIRLEKIRFGDLVEVYNGSTPSTKVKENFGGVIPWVTPKDLSDQQKKYIKAGVRNITEKGLESIGNRLLPKGTILLTSRAPIGLISIAQTEISTNQGFKNIVCNENKIDNEYLYYLLGTLIEELQNSGSGTTFKEISKRTLENFEFFIIKNLATQKRIAKVLSDLDSKIELNNKINQELEAMAKTLYDYWFVQFDFPDKNGKPYKSSGGKMVFNEELKREIPEGWAVKNLDEVSEIKRGTLVTAKTADLEGNIKVVSGGIDYSYFHSKSNRESNTITVSSSGANAGFINFWREPIFANDCTTVRGETDAETLVYLQFLKMRQDHIFKQARGSAQPHVYPKDLAVLKIELPNNDLFDLYGKKVLPANEIITNNLKQNQKLAALRDWLLPMLMNGQVTVGEAYAAQEEVLGMVAEEGATYGKEQNKR